MEVHLYERVNDLCHSLFHLLNCLITTASELREAEELSWCPSWSKSKWQGWSCPCGNGTDPIWTVLASSVGISFSTPLKPQQSNPSFCGIFPSLKQNFIAYRSSNVSDCIFEIHQLWQSGFSRVYSNCCYSCSFESEIINIGQSSHEIYS